MRALRRALEHQPASMRTWVLLSTQPCLLTPVSAGKLIVRQAPDQRHAWITNHSSVNVLGHAAGALIFAIFLALLFSRRGWSGARGRYLAALAAALSLTWNVGSLMVLVCSDLSAAATVWIVALSFSVLSFLPAVLLQISLEDGRRGLVCTGYLLSGIAAAMHFAEIRHVSPTVHFVALLLITVSFPALIAIALIRGGFRSVGRRASLGLSPVEKSGADYGLHVLGVVCRVIYPL